MLDNLDSKAASEQATESNRKPRIVLMGEFSAGKSTLTNILLDSQPLPMRVTATRLPPVQVSFGDPRAIAVNLDGSRREIDMEALEKVSLEDTLMVEVSLESDVLQLCDIVDMPGISDPNMPHDLWEEVIDPADHVIWCTHATQAWRQSEAAIWQTLHEQAMGHNILLITQFDKLQNANDKARVLKRVQHETKGLFEAVYPVCLLDALEAGDDFAAWERSGAAEFSEHVIRILMEITDHPVALVKDAGTVLQNDLRNTAELRKVAAAQALTEPVRPRRVKPVTGLRDNGSSSRRGASSTLGANG
jgi:GTPase SAR1 family protein